MRCILVSRSRCGFCFFWVRPRASKWPCTQAEAASKDQALADGAKRAAHLEAELAVLQSAQAQADQAQRAAQVAATRIRELEAQLARAAIAEQRAAESVELKIEVFGVEKAQLVQAAALLKQRVAQVEADHTGTKALHSKVTDQLASGILDLDLVLLPTSPLPFLANCSASCRACYVRLTAHVYRTLHRPCNVPPMMRRLIRLPRTQHDRGL